MSYFWISFPFSNVEVKKNKKLFNRLLDMKLLSGGNIILAGENYSLTQMYKYFQRTSSLCSKKSSIFSFSLTSCNALNVKSVLRMTQEKVMGHFRDTQLILHVKVNLPFMRTKHYSACESSFTTLLGLSKLELDSSFFSPVYLTLCKCNIISQKCPFKLCKLHNSFLETS